MNLPLGMEMALLDILSEQDEMAGREVAKRFEAIHGSSISYGTLYTTLRRLKEQHWVTTRDDEDQYGRVRFFTLDPNGKGALLAAQQYHAAKASFGLKEGWA